MGAEPAQLATRRGQWAEVDLMTSRRSEDQGGCSGKWRQWNVAEWSSPVAERVLGRLSANKGAADWGKKLADGGIR
jgi:hypothetical protein